MIRIVISGKLRLLFVIQIAAALATSGLTLSGCSFGEDNVGSIGDAAAPAPTSTPQIPESMKTNDFGNGPQGPPQGL
jgi:hypothetical protein